MALIACAECKKEISDKATACPHCGAPVPEGPSLVSRVGFVLKWGLVLFVGFFVYRCATVAGFGESPNATIDEARRIAATSNPPPATPTPVVATPPSPPPPPPDQALQKEIDRMAALKPEDFCVKELRKLKGKKDPLPQPWYDALWRTAKKYDVDGSHLSAIQDGHVVIGMTTCAAIAAWGRPQDINRSTYTFAVKEQWVYGGRNYLYFTDGKLDAFQN